jgi:uncharacterized protein YbbC (DUF1343 family)
MICSLIKIVFPSPARLFLTALLLLCFRIPLPAVAADHQVLPGIDVLAGQHFDILRGKRVGLITNQTGRTAAGISTIDVLFHAPGVHLTALFSPEHGIRGDSDDKLTSSVDSATGLPVHSLYGATCRPLPEMLQGLDVLVFDIQDIGARFYTYIGTLSLAMQAAQKSGILFVVLDRPNPIGGIDVQGAVSLPASPLKISAQRAAQQDTGCRTLTNIHPLPTRHGMTVGELARLFNVEYGINCNLTVVPMHGWRRSMYFDATGLAWVNPSPNMKSLTEALLYPGLGVLETTNLSVARGTEHPFEMYGAPWLDAAAVVRALAARPVPGIMFTSCTFVPTAPGHPYRGQLCNGVRVAVTDRELLNPVLAGMQMIQALYAVHPERYKADAGFAVQVGDRDVWDLLTRLGKSPAEVEARWNAPLERFLTVREKYLLY